MCRLLAAYRRDDWSPDDLATLTEHLTSCAECRQIEATYRTVGERIRQLPSITPPPDFRASVFAAIRAEERRVAPEVARLSRAATNPELPVVRPGVRLVRPESWRRVPISPRAGLAAAAVLVIGVLTASILPHITGGSFARTAASLNGVPDATLSLSSGHVSRYALSGAYAFAGSAAASSAWLVYAAAGTSREDQLFAENRKTQQAVPLLSTPTSAPITVRAVTDSWVIWSTGAGTSDSPWTLSASRLPVNGAISAPLTLVNSVAQGADTPVTLGGVWARGATVLVAASSARGTGILLRVDLSSGTPVTTVIARSSRSGHLLADPSVDGGSYYWSEVWLDTTTGLHSTMWRGDDSGHDQQISLDEASFHPTTTGNTLVWVEVAPDTTASATNAAPATAAQTDADADMLSALSGSLEARDLTTGQQWQVSPSADVTSVAADGSLILWHSNSQTHVYDLRTRTADSLDGQIHAAAFARAGDGAIVWQQSGSSNIYVADAK